MRTVGWDLGRKNNLTYSTVLVATIFGLSNRRTAAPVRDSLLVQELRTSLTRSQRPEQLEDHSATVPQLQALPVAILVSYITSVHTSFAQTLCVGVHAGVIAHLVSVVPPACRFNDVTLPQFGFIMAARNAKTARGPSNKENVGCFGGCFRPSHKAPSRVDQPKSSQIESRGIPLTEQGKRSANLEDLHSAVVVYQTAVPEAEKKAGNVETTIDVKAAKAYASDDVQRSLILEDSVIAYCDDIATGDESLACKEVQEDIAVAAVKASGVGEMESCLEGRGVSDTQADAVQISSVQRGIPPAVSVVLTESGNPDAPVRLDLLVNDDWAGAAEPPQHSALWNFVRSILLAFPFLPCDSDDIDW